MSADTGWHVGRAIITPVYETDAGNILQSGIALATPERVLGVPWLMPRFADQAGRLKGVVQAFVIALGDAVILVDTCVGNGKKRPGLPAWSELNTDFLQRLVSCGVEFDQVGAVVCTHLHFDHVGWNTRPAGGGWVPTFGRARYILCKTEFDYWAGRPDREAADDLAGVADSVLPVVEAGLADLVAPDHEVAPGVRLVPTPGHTPGHVSVLVESAGERAIVSGDAIHHPCQMAHPEWGIFSDFDPDQARRARIGLLAQCADTGTLLIGTHFPPSAAVTVRRDASAFRAW